MLFPCRSSTLTILLTIAFVGKAEDDPNVIYTKFLQKTVKNYGSWVEENDYDPSPISPQTVHLKTVIPRSVIISCQMTNQFVMDHSQTGSDKTTELGYLSGPSVRILRVTSDKHPLVFGGDYVASGKVLASATGKRYNVTFNGEGTWTMTTKASEETSFYGNFEISRDGFINLASQRTQTDFMFHTTWADVEFEGLWDSGEAAEHEDLIKEELKKLYSAFLLHDSKVNPSLKLFRQYLESTIQSKNLSSIVGDRFDPTSLAPLASTPPSVGSHLVVDFVAILTLTGCAVWNLLRK